MVAPSDEKSPAAGAGPERESERVATEWTGRRTAPNAAVLTRCRLVDRESHGGWMTLGELRTVIAGRIRMARGPVPLRVQWLFERAPGTAAEGPWAIVAELSEDASVTIDQAELATGDSEWILDRSMQRIALPDLHPGAHLVEIWRLCARPEDLQPPWLLGPFELHGVDADPIVLRPAGDEVPLGDWQRVGLPLYFGSVVYATEIEGRSLLPGERARLELPGLRGAAAVRVDTEAVRPVVGPPYARDLTEFWKEDRFKVEIEVTGCALNLFAAMRGDTAPLPASYGLTRPPEVVITSRPPSTEAEEPAPDSEQSAAK